MPFTLTQEQCDRIVFEVARALNLTTLTDFASATPELINAWRSDIAGRDAKNVPTAQNGFGAVYAKISEMITDPANSNAPLADVDKSGWLFLRAGANVNAGQTLEAFMAREYTRIEWQLRFGEDPGDAKIYQMSNGIAFNVARGIILGNSSPEFTRAAGVIPTIEEIGKLGRPSGD